MKRSYLILGSLCTAFAIANASLFTIASVIKSTPVEPTLSTYDGFDYSWVDLEPYIAHAFGGILGDTYTNSYEAFLLNYQLGHRIFEVDFFIADDGRTIIAHDNEHWQANTGKYHTLDLDLLFKILQEYPDIYIVTDTKFSDEESVRKQFTAFVETAKTIDITLLDRFIPQIYIPEMFDWVMDIYPWKSVIYTLYANPNWTPENVLDFAEKSGVRYITLFYTAASDEALELWESAGLLIGVHTINDLETTEEALSRGVQNIYTDYLLP